MVQAGIAKRRTPDSFSHYPDWCRFPDCIAGQKNQDSLVLHSPGVVLHVSRDPDLLDLYSLGVT